MDAKRDVLRDGRVGAAEVIEFWIRQSGEGLGVMSAGGVEDDCWDGRGRCAARETNKNKEGKRPSEIGGRHGASDGILQSAGSGNIRYDNSLLPATAYHCDPDRPLQMGVYGENDHLPKSW